MANPAFRLWGTGILKNRRINFRAVSAVGQTVCRFFLYILAPERVSLLELDEREQVLGGRMPQKMSFPGEETLLFAKNFIQHPKMLGSLIPSSRFLIDRLLSNVDWARARTLVEYGPGVGTITAHILERMSPDARLIVFEMNSEFVDYLGRALPDSRLHVVHGSAENVGFELERLGLPGADYIISGIPYTTMPEQLRGRIIHESREALNPGGAVLVYQFTRAVLPYLRACFSHVYQDYEPRNILPARLFYCTHEV